MNEADWKSSIEAPPMLKWLKGNRKTGKISDRTWRLFSCACCRRLGKKLKGKRVLDALDVAEAYADGEADLAAMQEADDWTVAARLPREVNGVASRAVYCEEQFSPSTLAFQTAGWALLVLKGPQEAAAQANLVREIFGNPFRPVKCAPRWRGEAVIQLAEQIYQERAFRRMPQLGAALEDAGCTDAALLDHCRKPTEHVPGCWLLDLLLGKRWKA